MANRVLLCLLALTMLGSSSRAQDHGGLTVSIQTINGKVVSGVVESGLVNFESGGKAQAVNLKDVLSIHTAYSATEFESQEINANLARLGNTVQTEAEIAAAKLTDIGLPVLTPLLKAYPDTEATEPDYRYRLFGRIMPGHSDARDRSLGLIRTADSKSVRGNLLKAKFVLKQENGELLSVEARNIRRIAVLRNEISRTFDLHALHHCTYVGFLDTGIIATPESSLVADAEGYVRLSFDEDGWSTDPDGIFEPLEGKRKLQEGFRWGSILGRVGPDGERWFVGKHMEKPGLGNGRLYFVINDNEHWQNNIGSFRVRITVKNAFDVGEPY